MDYIPTTHKFIAVLNKKMPIGRLMNALGHTTVGLAATYAIPAHLRLANYVDKDGGVHANISDNPFIILQADNSSQLRSLRTALLDRGFPMADFTNTMVEGTYAEQHEQTKATPEAELEYYCITTFGPHEVLDELTRRFSLWRD